MFDIYMLDQGDALRITTIFYLSNDGMITDCGGKVGSLWFTPQLAKTNRYGSLFLLNIKVILLL